MQRFKILIQIIKNMGLRYLCYRILHLFLTKIGWYKLVFPKRVKSKIFLSYSKWLNENKEYYIDYLSTNKIESLLSNDEKRKISQKASKIKNGIFLFFNSEEFALGSNYDWVTNPLNGHSYSSNLHWSKIDDFNISSGDIKYVWEKSRFNFLYTLIRDEQINGNKHKDYVFSQISEWIDANPVNLGPNWKCSQEISIRVCNWIFAIYFYKDNGVLDEELWQKILNSIFQQMLHVRKHINFSRIAVRNNHAITEALSLYIVGLLFPSLDEKEEWKRNGKKWFEQEIEYQIYSDGTFLQFSMNYHRVVIQLLTKAIVIAELNGEHFANVVYERAYNSINFLYQCQNDENGSLPNYGANDGALFFPLNNCNFRDFRPQLNALHYALTGKNLFTKGIWMEDTIWLTGNSKFVPKKFKIVEKKYGILRFEKSGYYLIREKKSFTFLRAGSHKDRPSQADNLHLDLWIDGDNILRDAGSYKYNTNERDLNYFFGSKSHNTVTLGKNDQMLKGDRFMWYHWTQALGAELTENDDKFIFNGQISAFRHIDNNAVHKRIINKKKGIPIWEISDELIHDTNLPLIQYWHPSKSFFDNFEISAKTMDGSEIMPLIEEGYYSSLYGQKEPSVQIVFTTQQTKIITIIKPKI